MAAQTKIQPDAPDEGDIEQTTRPLQKSGKRLKARPVAGSEPRSHDDDDVSDSPAPRALPAAAEAASEPRIVTQSTRLGPYQVVCELASGGMATVYLALYRSVEGFEKLCAVKRIHPHLAHDRSFTNMFADEAQIAARISHPYVCSVFSFGRTQQSHYIAMEFLRGEPLSAVSRRVARTPELGDDPRFPALAARLLANLAEGLHAAHTLRDDRGVPLEVVHRDVTPQNLFVLYDGSVRVTDFGIAHARRRLHQTQGQKLKGKLSYIAPEQLNDGTVDSRVDVWGLGVTLWELLAGRRLFLGSSEGETLAAVMSRVVQPPSTFRATVPQELDRIVLRALDRDVQKRYRTARDLARDLERFLSSVGDQVPAMDVADWMTTVFPQGAERIQTLVELAARVSAATADETVQRVPSTPPSAKDVPSRGSYVMLTAPPPRVSSLPPTRELAGGRRNGAVTPTEEPLIIPGSEPRIPLGDLAVPSSKTGSKPRLQLVEEVTAERSLLPRAGALASAEVPRSRARTGLVIGVVAAAVAFGAVLGLGKLRQHTPMPIPTAAPEVPARTAPAAAPVAPEALPEAPAPIAVDALPAAEPRNEAPAAKAPPKGRPVNNVAAAVASAAPVVEEPIVPATGELMVSGGSGDVLEHGRLLGHAPGGFKLSVGHHDLTLRTAQGSEQNFGVDIVRHGSTLITVSGGR